MAPARLQQWTVPIHELAGDDGTELWAEPAGRVADTVPQLGWQSTTSRTAR